MPTEPEKTRLAGRHLQVLRVLADAPHSCDVNDLLTRRFKLETMADLVRGELAAVRIETRGESRLEDRGCSHPDHRRQLAGARRFDHAKTTASSAKRPMNFTTCELDYAAFGSKESDFWGELDELSERQEVV